MPRGQGCKEPNALFSRNTKRFSLDELSRLEEKDQQRKDQLDQLEEVIQKNEQIKSALKEIVKLECRTQGCKKEAEFIPYGKLIAPHALGPRCYECASKFIAAGMLDPSRKGEVAILFLYGLINEDFEPKEKKVLLSNYDEIQAEYNKYHLIGKSFMKGCNHWVEEKHDKCGKRAAYIFYQGEDDDFGGKCEEHSRELVKRLGSEAFIDLRPLKDLIY